MGDVLQSFNFAVEHVSGKDNQLPVALSQDPGGEIFSYGADGLDALLPPERTVPHGEVILASIIAQYLRERILQAQQEEHVDVRNAARFLQPTQTLQYSDGAYFIEEHGCSPRVYVLFSY